MSYIEEVLNSVAEKYSYQPEFLQAVKGVLTAAAPAIVENESFYRKNALLERLTEPDRAVSFRVAWQADDGSIRVNKGYRVQFNNAIGPYKGGLRFHPSVNLSIMKFLGFEQVFKNALTTLPLGGAKGGADFDGRGKSDGEIMRFCQAFMTELYRHIGPDTDVPAGDIGVGAREIGYLFGQYKRIRGAFEYGTLTGKAIAYGGIPVRPEATGYGCSYFLQNLLSDMGEEINGKTFAISGFGNVAYGAARKITELGGKVLTLSGREGTLYFKNGLPAEGALEMPEFRISNSDKSAFAKKYGGTFIEGVKPWGVCAAEVCMPCATQNEIDLSDAKTLKANGTRFVVEGANMPTDAKATEYFKQNGVIVCPAKAANAGGVAVSGLEMSYNAQKLPAEGDEVDQKLNAIMRSIYRQTVTACEQYSLGRDLTAGADIAAFKKVTAAMIAQGVL